MDLPLFGIIGSTLLKTLGPLFGGGQRPKSPYEAELVQLLMQLSDPGRFQTLAKPATDYMTATGERALSRRGMFSSSASTQLQSDIGRTIGQMFMRGQEGALRGWGSLVSGTQWAKPTWGQRLAGVGSVLAGGGEDLTAWYEQQESQKRMEEWRKLLFGGGEYGKILGTGEGNVWG